MEELKEYEPADRRETAIILLAMLLLCFLILGGLFYSGYLIGKKQAINKIEKSDEFVRLP